VVERSDVCAVPAAGIVGEAMMAIALAGAFLEKFGGDSLAEMQRRLRPNRRLQITLLARADEAQFALSSREGVIEIRLAAPGGDGYPVLEVDFAGDDLQVTGLLRELVERGLPLLRFNESPHDLEEVFMHATKGIVQ